MEKNRKNIKDTILRHKNRLLYGTLIAGAAAATPAVSKFVNYEMSAIKILLNEGGYADDSTIDQPTKYGVTNPTLQAFKKNFPKEAQNFPSSVKSLTLMQAKKLMRTAFYDHYKIGEIKNKSTADMLFDVVYNHEYKTFREFVKDGLIAVKKMRHEDIETRPRNWKDVPKFLNECSKEELSTFYNTVVKSRIDFLNRSGYIKKYKGLKKRAKQFSGKFRAYVANENTPQTRVYAYLDKYFKQKDSLMRAESFQSGFKKNGRKTDISWEQALLLNGQSRV